MKKCVNGMSSTARCVGSFAAISASVLRPGLLPRTLALVLPNTASKFLEEHFVPRLTITSLTPSEMLRAMRDAQRHGVRGGGIFDYLHLVAARKAKASRIYTLNLSNFRAFYRPGDPEIMHPGV